MANRRIGPTRTPAPILIPPQGFLTIEPNLYRASMIRSLIEKIFLYFNSQQYLISYFVLRINCQTIAHYLLSIETSMVRITYYKKHVKSHENINSSTNKLSKQTINFQINTLILLFHQFMIV